MMFEESKEVAFSKNWLEPFYNCIKVTGFTQFISNKNDNKVQFAFEIEGKPEGSNFKGKDRMDGKPAQGKLGKCNIGIYTSPSNNKSVRGLMETFIKLGSRTGTLKEMVDKVFTKAFTATTDGFEYQLNEQTNEYMIKVFTSLANILIKSNKFVWLATTAKVWQGKLYIESLKSINVVLNSGEKIMAGFAVAEEDFIESVTDTNDYILLIEYKNSAGKKTKSECVKLDSKWWVAGLEEGTFDVDTPSALDDLAGIADMPDFLQ